MNRKIKLKNRDLVYKLRRSARAKKMRITINCDASVVVTLPTLASESFAEKFIREKFDWITKKVDYFKENKKRGCTHSLDKNDYLKNKERARVFIENKIQELNSYDFRFNKVYIKNQKTRWGSCSKNRNLNFNYKLIHLPEKLAEYVIIHELCHLKEFNHSENFWKLVSETVPNYKECRKELRKMII